MLTLIAAINRKGVIGDSKKKGMLWKDPEDIDKFNDLICGQHLLVGSKTWEMLPDSVKQGWIGNMGCTVTVITRQPTANVFERSTFEEAVKLNPDAWVLGGAELYKTALESGLVKYLHLTMADNDDDGDVYFPLEALSKAMLTMVVIDETIYVEKKED